MRPLIMFFRRGSMNSLFWPLVQSPPEAKQCHQLEFPINNEQRQLRALSTPHGVTVSYRPRPRLGSQRSSASIAVRRFWYCSLVTFGSLDYIPILEKAGTAFWLLSFYKQEGAWFLGRPILWERTVDCGITLARFTSPFSFIDQLLYLLHLHNFIFF